MSKEPGRVPIYEVWFQATGSGAAATVFMAMMLLALFITSIGSVQSGSRLTWSFAQDDAIFLSAHVKRTHDRLGIPGWAILFNGFWLSVLGCVHLISSSGEQSYPINKQRSILQVENRLRFHSIQRLHRNSHAYGAHFFLLSSGAAHVATPGSKAFTHPKPLLSREVWMAGQRRGGELDGFCPGDFQPSCCPTCEWGIHEYVTTLRRSRAKYTKADDFSSSDYTAIVLVSMILLSLLNWVFYARKHYQGPNVTLLVKYE